ncbi:MAG: molybdenum cofactor biosynthesis protein B [Candidatus Binatia bacterium]
MGHSPTTSGGGDHAHPAKPASSAHHARDARRVACAVVTVSDTRTGENDTSGGEIRSRLEKAGHRVEAYRIVADDPALVRRLLEEFAADNRVEAVLLSGGTGIAARDTTFEAVTSLLTKRIDGFGELFRMLSFEEIGAAAMLSRAVAGLAGTMAVFSMPGSTAACRLAMDRLILPQLAHVVGLARPREPDA